MLRLDQSDTLETAILKLSGGVGGAIEVLAEVVKQGAAIHPELESSGIGHLLLLDELGIYGTDIYILYRDKCGSDIRQLLLLLRAAQLGKYPKSKLRELASDQFNQVSISGDVWKELDYVVDQGFS